MVYTLDKQCFTENMNDINCSGHGWAPDTNTSTYAVKEDKIAFSVKDISSPPCVKCEVGKTFTMTYTAERAGTEKTYVVKRKITHYCQLAKIIGPSKKPYEMALDSLNSYSEMQEIGEFNTMSFKS